MRTPFNPQPQCCEVVAPKRLQKGSCFLCNAGTLNCFTSTLKPGVKGGSEAAHYIYEGVVFFARTGMACRT